MAISERRRSLSLAVLLSVVFKLSCRSACEELSGSGERAAARATGSGGRGRDPLVSGCSIYILNTNEVAKEQGIPQCDLSNIVVDARTQVPYLREFSSANKHKRVIPTPHYFSGNSAPWFTKRAVERSPYLSKDLNNASVILVDDYCYKLWWLSYIHSDKEDQLPGESLMEVYQHILERPEWVTFKGRKHVFFQSHTGFAHGPLGDTYERFLCETLVNSMHAVNVRASRLRCKRVPYNPDNFVITPGSVHYHDIREFQEREKERLHNRDPHYVHHERDFLLFFKGKCTPLNFTWKTEAVKNKIAESTVNVGKLMRVEIVKEIQGMGRDIRAACTGDSEEMKDVQNERPHWEQMDEFTRSTFCLLVPGDSQTSRRLPEAIMAGCIPVFPGPPYHTMPFASLVDYSKFAIFFQLEETPWTKSITVHWEVESNNPNSRPHHPTDAEWWVPDVANIQDLVVQVKNAREMVQFLKKMPRSKLAAKQLAVLAVQPKFAYLEHGDGKSPTAADLIVKAMCERAVKQQQNPPPLVEPRALPAFQSRVAPREERQRVAEEVSGVAEGAKAAGRASQGDSGKAAAGAEGGNKHHVAVRRGELVEAAREAGERPKKRRKRAKREHSEVAVAGEHLSNNGAWQVSVADVQDSGDL